MITSFKWYRCFKSFGEEHLCTNGFQNIPAYTLTKNMRMKTLNPHDFLHFQNWRMSILRSDTSCWNCCCGLGQPMGWASTWVQAKKNWPTLCIGHGENRDFLDKHTPPLSCVELKKYTCLGTLSPSGTRPADKVLTRLQKQLHR